MLSATPLANSVLKSGFGTELPVVHNARVTFRIPSRRAPGNSLHRAANLNVAPQASDLSSLNAELLRRITNISLSSNGALAMEKVPAVSAEIFFPWFDHCHFDVLVDVLASTEMKCGGFR